MYVRKLIKPAPGLIIPLPDGNGNLPAEGKALVLSSYWYRLEQDKDVTFEDVPQESVQPEMAATEKSKSGKAK